MADNLISSAHSNPQLEPFRYTLQLSVEKLLPEDPDIDEYITTINGEICFDGDDDVVLAGKLKSYFVDLYRAEVDRVPYSEVFDAHSDELLELSCLFNTRLREYSRLTQNARNALPEGRGVSYHEDNFLLLSRLEILPRFRGYKLGLWALREALFYLVHVYRVTFIAMKPLPLQGELSEALNPSKWQV